MALAYWIAQRSPICSLTSKLSTPIQFSSAYVQVSVDGASSIKSDVLSSIPLYPSHRQNYLLIKSQPADILAWSLFCASDISSKYNTPQFPPPADASAGNLVAKADAPPAWAEKYRTVPLIGNYLNIMAQAQSYYAVLENCVDFIATDLEKGLESGWIGKRVGIKEKSKVE